MSSFNPCKYHFVIVTVLMKYRIKKKQWIFQLEKPPPELNSLYCEIQNGSVKKIFEE
jgi:hypothetical protein